MVNDSPEPQNPGEFSLAQTLNKLVYFGSKHQVVNYKKYKTAVIEQSVALAIFGTV